MQIYMLFKRERNKSSTNANIKSSSFPGVSVVKKPPSWSLGWEDPPEKEMAAHSSIII